MAISMSKAKSLCNANELALVTASARTQLNALSAPRLRQKVTLARKLRDKWRDQAERQRREAQSKQGARQTTASARSAEKSELFAEVLERFEARLAKAEGQTTGVAARKTKPSRVRSAGHRADRAVVREELDQTRLEMKEAKRASRTKAASKKKTAQTKPATPAKLAKPKRKPVAIIAISSATPTMEALAPPTERDMPPSKKRSIGPVQPKSARSTSKIAAVQGLRVTDGQQTRVTARAKQNRLKASGIVRIQKHTSAQNKRRQGKRDSR